jgi:hypothetical protein
MATYEEKKKIALGFAIPNEGFRNSSVLDVLKPQIMEYAGGNQFFDKKLGENIEEQKRFKIGLYVWDEYDADQKSAKKNFTDLTRFLLAGNANRLEKLFAKSPAAEWLNIIFLDDAELNDLLNKIKKSSPECRNVIATALKKEVTRLVNFKTFFEQIITELFFVF